MIYVNAKIDPRHVDKWANTLKGLSKLSDHMVVRVREQGMEFTVGTPSHTAIGQAQFAHDFFKLYKFQTQGWTNRRKNEEGTVFQLSSKSLLLMFNRGIGNNSLSDCEIVLREGGDVQADRGRRGGPLGESRRNGPHVIHSAIGLGGTFSVTLSSKKGVIRKYQMTCGEVQEDADWLIKVNLAADRASYHEAPESPSLSCQSFQLSTSSLTSYMESMSAHADRFQITLKPRPRKSKIILRSYTEGISSSDKIFKHARNTTVELQSQDTMWMTNMVSELTLCMKNSDFRTLAYMASSLDREGVLSAYVPYIPDADGDGSIYTRSTLFEIEGDDVPLNCQIMVWVVSELPKLDQQKQLVTTRRRRPARPISADAQTTFQDSSANLVGSSLTQSAVPLTAIATSAARALTTMVDTMTTAATPLDVQMEDLQMEDAQADVVWENREDVDSVITTAASTATGSEFPMDPNKSARRKAVSLLDPDSDLDSMLMSVDDEQLRSMSTNREGLGPTQDASQAQGLFD